MPRKAESTGSRAVRAAVQRLESLGRAGLTHLAKPPRTEASGPTPEGEASPVPPGAAADEDQPVVTDDRVAALAELEREVAACTRCEELACTRIQTVFGVGNPHARLVFVGEAPGGDEDRQGEPFVGRAGQLLTRIIQACTLKREEVYICNILRCRPPGNRNPLPAEAANCRGHLDRQLAIIQPEFICCLGSVAAQNLLDTSLSIGRLRGRFHEYSSLFHEGGSVKVLCTYHPAYLLRNPAAKRQVWEDMQLLMAEMGIELPKE